MPHQVPLSEVKTEPSHLAILERWMKSYNPDDLFDENGELKADIAALAPVGTARMSANPHANGGQLSKPLVMPDIAQYAYEIKQHGVDKKTSTTQMGQLMRDIYKANPHNFRLFCPEETNSNKLGAVFEVESRCLVGQVLPTDEKISTIGRVMEVLSEHNCEGWLEAYTLTGRHGLFASYEAFTMIVASMISQHIKWLEACEELPWRSPIPSLNVLLTSTCWRNVSTRNTQEQTHMHPLSLFTSVLTSVAMLCYVMYVGSQRLFAPGSRSDGYYTEQARTNSPLLPATRCQLSAGCGRSLLQVQELREPHHNRQAATAPIPQPGRRQGARQARCQHLEVGKQRPGQPARHSDDVLR